jgi:hypothetical protein
MSIDGIGKGPPRIPGGAGGSAPEKATEAFKIQGGEQSASAEQASASGPFERFQRGELDFNGFLQAKVDAAVQHLRLPSAELDFIKGELRAQMASDPVLMELVRRATGKVPDAEG